MSSNLSHDPLITTDTPESHLESACEAMPVHLSEDDGQTLCHVSSRESFGTLSPDPEQQVCPHDTDPSRSSEIASLGEAGNERFSPASSQTVLLSAEVDERADWVLTATEFIQQRDKILQSIRFEQERFENHRDNELRNLDTLRKQVVWDIVSQGAVPANFEPQVMLQIGDQLLQSIEIAHDRIVPRTQPGGWGQPM